MSEAIVPTAVPSGGVGVRLDAHEWARDALPFLAEVLHLVPAGVERIAWDGTFREIVTRVPMGLVGGPRISALMKLHARWTETDRGYRDPEMGGVNVAGLLVEAWRAAQVHEEWEPFGELLEEIGQHCVAGDSTRLFWFWWARLQ